jgi:hypothetical protein
MSHLAALPARTLRSRLAPFVFLGLALVVAGCTTTVVQKPSSEMAGMSGMLSVERFLQAVNSGDFDAMARLFGTADGSWSETGGGRCGVFRGRCNSEEDVEIQMALIAEVLTHDDYRIVSDQVVPGREHPTRRLGVDVTQGNRVFRNVGFTVVQTEDGLWLVQQVELEKIVGEP